MIELRPKSAHAAMLIRRPVDEVFNAFIDPAVTSKFWFTHGTGPLVVGKSIKWKWEMYGAETEVTALEIETNKRILIDWGDFGEPALVEWRFTEIPEKGTFVEIVTAEFKGSQKDLLQQVRDQSGGFTIVLAGLKAWLEHNLQLNLVLDRFPAELKSEKP